jgi:hypothetical protein
MKRTAFAVFCLLVLFMLLTALSNSDAQQAEGKTLVQERCAPRCHALDTVRAAVGTLDAAGWNALVGRMVAHGAELSPAEKDAVVEYLAGLAKPGAL